jgi:hypothetical protein
MCACVYVCCVCYCVHMSASVCVCVHPMFSCHVVVACVCGGGGAGECTNGFQGPNCDIPAIKVVHVVQSWCVAPPAEVHCMCVRTWAVHVHVRVRVRVRAACAFACACAFAHAPFVCRTCALNSHLDVGFLMPAPDIIELWFSTQCVPCHPRACTSLHSAVLSA